MIVHLFMSPDYESTFVADGMEFNEVWTDPVPLGEDEYVGPLDLDDLSIPEIRSLQDKLHGIGNTLAVQTLGVYLLSLGA